MISRLLSVCLLSFLCGYFLVVSLTLLKWVFHILFPYLPKIFPSTKKINEREQNAFQLDVSRLLAVFLSLLMWCLSWESELLFSSWLKSLVHLWQSSFSLVISMRSSSWVSIEGREFRSHSNIHSSFSSSFKSRETDKEINWENEGPDYQTSSVTTHTTLLFQALEWRLRPENRKKRVHLSCHSIDPLFFSSWEEEQSRWGKKSESSSASDRETRWGITFSWIPLGWLSCSYDKASLSIIVVSLSQNRRVIEYSFFHCCGENITSFSSRVGIFRVNRFFHYLSSCLHLFRRSNQ